MPSELFVLRHGLCTGNAADQASRKGDHSLFTPTLRSGPSDEWPLVPSGLPAIRRAGEWLRAHSPHFDHYVTSPLLRAQQTSVELGFKNARWVLDPLLRERNWGGLECLPHPERVSRLVAAGRSAQEDSLSWHPPNGESLEIVMQRVRECLARLQARFSHGRVLLVTHGGPIQAIRVLQRQLPPPAYATFIAGSNHVRNAQIFRFHTKKREDDPFPFYSMEQTAFLSGDQWTETAHSL